MRPEQNHRHAADDIFKCFIFNEEDWISIQISLKFVSEGPIDNKSVLRWMMVWYRTGDKPLPEPVLTNELFLWLHMASLGLMNYFFKCVYCTPTWSSLVPAHDDVIKWKHFSCYRPSVRGIHWSPVNSPHKGHWRGALMFSLICAWINKWVNNRAAGDLRRHRVHYDVTVMECHSRNNVKSSGTALTYWGRVTHICVSKLTITGSDNGLSPDRRQAIIWTNDGILLIRSLGTNFSEISIGIQTFYFKKMHLKMSSAKWRPFCLGLNVLITKLGHWFLSKFLWLSMISTLFRRSDDIYKMADEIAQVLVRSYFIKTAS